MGSYRLVGIIGTILSALFSTLTIRRSYIAWNVLNRDLLHPKIIFHASVSLFALAELIYSLNLIIYKSYSLWGYAFHISGIFFFTLAYATVLHIWGQTIGRHHRYTHRAGALVVSMNFITTIIAIGFLVSSKDFKHFYHHFEVVNFLLILVFCITNIFFTLGMLRYGLSLQKRVKNSPITSLADQQRREQILLRINVVLVVCATCFSLRLIALDPLSGIGLVGWFFVSYWIPFLLPGLTLLFIMRVTPPHAPIATQIQSPLLPDQESNLSIKDSDIPQISPGQSRFSSFGRLSSPILPLPLNLMDLEGLEGLLVEPRGSAVSLISNSDQKNVP